MWLCRRWCYLDWDFGSGYAYSFFYIKRVMFDMAFNVAQGKWQRCVFLITFATVVFRGDTVVLLAPLVLSMLLSRRASLPQIIWWGLSAAVLSLFATVLVDSYFWQRWLWPEGEVLWFNIVQNKSSEWGVSPPLWYFTSALPRALQSTALMIPLGLRSFVLRCKIGLKF